MRNERERPKEPLGWEPDGGAAEGRPGVGDRPGDGGGRDEAREPPEPALPPAAGRPPSDPAQGPPPDPDDRESAYELLRRGQALAAKRHFAQAAIVLGRAARLEPHKGSILEALGRALYNSGQHERARETFERLLEIDPSSDYGHYALGQSLKQLGRRREARTHLRIAVALAPSSRLYAGALRRLGSPPRGGLSQEGRSGRNGRGLDDGDPGEGPESGPEARGGADQDKSGPGRVTS